MKIGCGVFALITMSINGKQGNESRSINKIDVLDRHTGVAVQNVERSRTSKVSGSCQRLTVHVSASWSLCREMAKTRARWKL